MGERGKIFHVHFRNINSPEPPWVEVFPDNGYVDMYRVMKTLKEIGYKGTMIPDHIPVFAKSSAGYGVGSIYIIAYMRGLLDAVNGEDISS
ncbi:MAG TPA: mannonate dehydratase [Anaerolineae bacterium]|nr:mannonate dehydratase [Anaerolineae bacterium]